MLGDEVSVVRQKAAEALGKLGDVKAVELLCQALRDECYWVRASAAEALGNLEDAAAVVSLCHAVGDENLDVRQKAVKALGKLGPVAVEGLCQTLGVKDKVIRNKAAEALAKLGNATMLPRKVIMETRLTPQQRFKALNALRRVKYKNGTTVLRYPLPDLGEYCQQMLQDPDVTVRQAAQTFLDVSSLLIASGPDETNEKVELLRGAASSASGMLPKEMLRASFQAKTEAVQPEKRRGPLARLLGR